MTNRFIKPYTFQCFCFFLTFMMPQYSLALDSQTDECAEEILLAYFPAVFVKETLQKFSVPKDQWDAIVNELSEKDKSILKDVEAKASTMSPNPLKDPQQRQAAVKLFRDTLFSNFASVLKAHGVNDEKKIQEMLEDIQKQKAKRFALCMEKERQEAGSDLQDEEDMEDGDESLK